MGLAKHIGKRILAVSATMGAAVALLVGSSPAAMASSQSIAFGTGGRIDCNWSMTSSSVHLVFQCDGNLVLYRNSDGHAMWASGTTGFGHPNVLIFHEDGFINLSEGIADKCQIGTGGATAVVQDDGNFVFYGPGGNATWDTGTWGNRQGTVHGCPNW